MRGITILLHMHWMTTYTTALLDFFLEIAPLLLLGLLIAGLLHVLFPEHLIDKHLGRRDGSSVFKATFFGIPIPLCSCSVIPVMSSLKRKGASNGASVSFLVAAPQIGADSWMLTFGLLGPLFATFRIAAAFVTALLAGLAENLLPENKSPGNEEKIETLDTGGRWQDRLRSFPSYVSEELLGSIADSLLIGILIATLIVILIPEGFLAGLTGGSSFLSMLVMLVIGIPMYVCATASTPIAAALMLKGISPGAALVFLLAGPATNAITISTVSRMLGKRATVIYLTSIALVSLGAGFLLDFAFRETIMAQSMAHQHQNDASWLQWLGAAGLTVLLIKHYYGVLRLRFSSGAVPRDSSDAHLKLQVAGMTCAHCVKRLSDNIQVAMNPVELAVDLKSGHVLLTDPSSADPVWQEKVQRTIEDAGFQVVDNAAE